METPRLLDIMKRLSLTAARAMPRSFPGSVELEESYNKRINPVEFFSKTFNYPVTLLSAMFDTGCILSGSRALDFFIPGSAQPDSDWDFYVPGYAESVVDMISALTFCGVTWDLEGDRIKEELMANGSAITSNEVLTALSSWYGGVSHPATPRRVGTTLHDIVLKFRHLKAQGVKERHFIITRHATGVIDIAAADPVSHENKLSYEDFLGRRFGILQGSISTADGNETVQLIIGSQYGSIKSCMSFISNSYASHVQCFMSGWCASHMYYRQANNRHAFTWKAKGQSFAKVQNAIAKYEKRGFEFSEPKNLSAGTRTLDDGESLFIDYGDLYRPYLRECDYEFLDECLYERRQNIQGISWRESDGRILDFRSSWENCFRASRHTFVSAGPDIPKKRWRRLSNAVAINTQRPNANTIRGFRSVVGWRAYKRGWQMRLLKESGTVFPGLRDATPWSWVL